MKDQLQTTLHHLAFVHHDDGTTHVRLVALQALLDQLDESWIVNTLTAAGVEVEPNVPRRLARITRSPSTDERCPHKVLRVATCLQCVRSTQQPPPKGG